MSASANRGCLRGLRLAVTIPPAHWFGGVDHAFALDMAFELRDMGASLLEIDVSGFAKGEPGAARAAIDAVNAFRPDVALSLPNAGYAMLCRDGAGRNVFWEQAGVPTALIWDHGVLQFARVLMEDPAPACPAESQRGFLARIRRALDHPLLLHYSPDRSHTAIMDQFGILDTRNVRSFVQGAFPVYARYGIDHIGEEPTLTARLAFVGNVYLGRAESMPFWADPVLRGIEESMVRAKRENITRNLWDPMMEAIAGLEAAVREERALDPGSSYFWKFAHDEIACLGNTEARLAVFRSLRHEFEFHGNFTEPETASRLDLYGIRPGANLNCITDLPALYKNCEMLVDVIHAGYFSGSSPKITSCFASGGFALFDYKDDFRAALGEIAEAVMYRSTDQLNAMIEHYRSHPARRREIAREMQHSVLERFTFGTMCRRILVEDPAWRVAAAVERRRASRGPAGAPRGGLLAPCSIPADGFERIRHLLPGREPELRPRADAAAQDARPTLPVAEPNLEGNESAYLKRCVESGWISSAGSFVSEFERRFAREAGCEYGIACSSGTTALHLATATLGLGPGDEVIIPAFTMVAVASAVAYTGATPVLADAELDSWNIDPARIEARITPRTKAIIVVHTYGHPAAMDAILAIARRHGLPVIEDAAEAHGAEYWGRRTGSLGDMGCFSFYANKIVTTGEGGMLVTNNPEIARVARNLRDHAFSPERHFWHKYRGFSYRMTNLQAAVGLAQTERLAAFVEKRRENARLYRELLGDVAGLRLPIEAPGARSVFWMFGLLVNPEFGMSRDDLRSELAERGIETRSFFIPIHLQPVYYRDYLGETFPAADLLCERGLYLPSSNRLTNAEIEYVAASVAAAAEKSFSSLAT